MVHVGEPEEGGSEEDYRAVAVGGEGEEGVDGAVAEEDFLREGADDEVAAFVDCETVLEGCVGEELGEGRGLVCVGGGIYP